MTEPEFGSRRIMVTGGASGIGYAVAEKLTAEGAQVVLCDINDALLLKAGQQLGDSATGLVCNVTDAQSMEESVHAITETGNIDGLVCCAGVPDMPGPAEKLDATMWSRVIDSHLTGTMNACKSVGAAMLGSGGGSIVNLASVLSFNAGPVIAYGAAKAAIVNLTASLAVQWASRGVRVNAVAPGWTDTPFLRPEARQGQRDLAPILAATPIGRLIDPAEIAEVIVFLLSPRSSAVVGTTVVCDGGVIAGAGWPPFGGFPTER